jgi:uncharacterized protein (TIGR02246 family)
VSDDEEAVRRVLAEYSRHYDSGSADEWADLFAEDGRFVISGKATEGRSAIGGYMRDAQVRFGRGLHLTSNTVVDVVGPEATASSDYLYVRPGTDGPVVVAAGHYRDRLVRDEDRWRFHERSVSLLGVPEPGADG